MGKAQGGQARGPFRLCPDVRGGGPRSTGTSLAAQDGSWHLLLAAPHRNSALEPTSSFHIGFMK